MKTILENIYNNVISDPNKFSLIWLDENGNEIKKITYDELWRNSGIVKENLLKKIFLKKDDRILIIFPPGIKFYIVFIACLRSGIISIPVYPPNTSNLKDEIKKIEVIIKNSQSKIILTTKKIKKNFFNVITEKDIIIKSIREKKISHQISKNNLDNINFEENDIAFIQYTSGSTSEPKGVMVTHKNLLHNIQIITKIIESNKNFVGVSWLPQYHDYGLSSVLFMLYNGGLSYLISPLTFIKNPLLWFKIISEKKAHCSSAPFFAYSLILRKWNNQFSLDLSNLEYLQCAGEPIHKETIDKFLETFKKYGLKENIFCPAYGLAEHVCYVSSHPKKKSFKISNGRLSCGYLLQNNDIDIKIVNPETLEECKIGEEGEIWVNSPSKAIGYWNLPELTKEIFYAKMKNNNNEYLRTEDLGYIEDNNLFITGRIKDLIIINGKNIYPQDIEYYVSQSSEYIKSGNIAVFSIEQNKKENIFVIAEIRNENLNKDIFFYENISKKINYSLQEKNIKINKIYLVMENTIPKTTSGKIKRQETKKKFLNNELKIIFNYKKIKHIKLQSNIENELVKMWKEIFEIEDIDIDSNFFELGGDSIKTVEVIFALKEKFQISNFEITDLMKNATIKDLSRIISEKLQKY